MTAALAAVAVAMTLPAPAQAAQPAVRPAEVKAAPTMPIPGPIKASSNGKPISVPAAASMSTGVFTIFSALGRPASRTTIKTTPTPANGTPLLDDWNGDGVDTPGRFDNGKWFITNGAAGTRPWELMADFGAGEGNIPLTARFDGDRYPDLAVFNNGVWKWQESTKGGVRTENFGEAGDRPVTGDWDGDGRDDIGVYRNGTWLLRIFNVTKKPKVAKGATVQLIPDAKAAIITYPWGLPTDTPITGDWDGNGRDSIGVVRGNAKWILSEGPLNPKTKKGKKGKAKPVAPKSKTLTIPLASGQTPLVGSQATANYRCPTASKAAEAAGLELAKQVVPPARLRGNETGDGYPEIKATVLDGLRYAMTNDYTKRLRGQWSQPYYDAVSTHRTQEEAIRRSGNTALAAAIMITTAEWDNYKNMSKARMTAYARWQIRSLACQHAANTPGGWGLNWQSALWSTTIGQAAWLLWPKLAPQERAYVANMVAAEADAVAERGPKYYRNREGQELAPGNSKADEDSWDLTAPSLALAMMPRNHRAKTWRKATIEYGIASFARPSDLTNNQIVNGINISQALPGTNANEDGTIINHGIVNPDYIQNVMHLWWGASMLRVAKQAVPEAMFLNADIVYRALSVVKFDSPPYAAPGGTVYQPGGQIYYPMGVKWGTRRPATFTGVDGFAAVYAAPDTNAPANLAAHARDTRGMQQRFTDGRIYAAGNAEESYALGKEEYALGQTALAWWAGAVPSGPGLKVDKGSYEGINLNPRGADR